MMISYSEVSRHQGRVIFLEYTGEGNTEKTLFLVGKVPYLLYMLLLLKMIRFCSSVKPLMIVLAVMKIVESCQKINASLEFLPNIS